MVKTAKDTTKLALLIISWGKFNNFTGSFEEVKRVIDTIDVKFLESKKDQDLMNDALAGIKIAKEITFDTDGIIAINKALHHSDEEDPAIPGHLRNAKENHNDAVIIMTDPYGSDKGAYFPSDVVTKEDLDQIVDRFKASKQTNFDGLRLFAELSKLQPFQDGNKRTALLAVNTALNTWKNENYFILPFDEIDFAQFSLGLMRYYRADNEDEEEQALKLMQMSLPKKSDIMTYNNLESSDKIDINKLKNRKIKKF
ncbi:MULTISPECIES: Fic family protein [Lactobacillus]|uniref:Fic family protein n=1 Tax=Lactobacillus xujianguonis TaxID=2495899 RepID=A0A437SW25_9LACO|nr:MULTISPECIES: Fic family protein [Lactobacillus]RVU71113.1 Fic family protein [Lactobacillus xujianguonis]RVU77461.1 Fic family protein [Lactobacillus xujianguonis]